MFKRCHIQILVVLIVLAGVCAQAADWPMWKHNSGRTASSPDALPSELHLQWVRQLPQARQAWRDKSNSMLFFDASYEPIVADKLMFVGSMNTDSITAYSTETGAEKWRFYTDGPVRFAPVAYKDKLYVGSDDGYLYCLDALAGELVWKKRGGPSDHKILGNERLIGMWPIRGAPVIHNDVLYCAAGIWPFMGTFIYALNPSTGEEIWANSGNGSRWITQQHGAQSFAGVAPQGYIAATDDILLVPSGRSAPGAFDIKTGEFLYNQASSRQFGKDAGGYAVSVAGETFACRPALYALDTGKGIEKAEKGVMTAAAYYVIQGDELTVTPLNVPPDPESEKKAPPPQAVKLPKEVGRAYIKAGNILYCAKDDGTISAVNIGDVKSPSVSWQGKIEGKAWTMLAADDRLFVVNAAGSIFCFGPKKNTVVKHAINKGGLAKGLPKVNSSCNVVLNNCEVPNGYCVVLGADRNLVSEVLLKSKFHVIVVDPRPKAIADLRKAFDGMGLYGDRVTAFVADPFRAGLPPYLANALILTAKQKLAAGQLSAMFKVLRPYGGVAVMTGTKQSIDPLVKTAKLQRATTTQVGDFCLLKREGSLPGSASWTHQYADAGNSVVSKDQLVKPPFGLLWFGGPTNDNVLPRHGHGPNPQVAGGRIFIEGANMLRSMDAYTGRLLWERQLEGVGHYYDNTGHHPGANNIGSNYVSLEDAVYILYKEKCLKLDPATGETRKEFTLPANEDGKLPIFGSLRVEGDFLVVTGLPLGISTKTEAIPIKDGKNIRIEDAKGVKIKDGKGITIVDGEGINYWKMKLVTKGDNVVRVKDGKRVNIKDRKELMEIELGMWVSIRSCKSVTIEEGDGITVESAKGAKIQPGEGIETNVPYASASRTVAVLDRHSGQVLWSRQAVHGFRHNAVIAVGDTVFCIDKLSPQKEGFLARRGLMPPKTTSLLALDIRTGKVIWKSNENVFGTWLGYSTEHDVLIQGGSAFRDRANDEIGIGIVTYRGKDGSVLWKDLERKYSGPLMLRHREMIMNGTGGGAWDLFTGKSTGWSWTRRYGCNTAIGGEHVLTFRSGAAGYYDMSNKGGTGNLGGFKSGCTSNLIPADGILTAPDYTRTCTCSYQNQTSLGLVYMPEAEIWTYAPMKTDFRLGINFGAPGDRVSTTGTLWSEFPLAGSPAVRREVKADGTPFRHHSMLFSGNEPWIGSSGIEGASQLSIAAKSGIYRVRLYFAEPDPSVKPGQRVFDVILGGDKVLSNFDVVAASKGVPRATVIKELKGVEVKDGLILKLKAQKGATIISGVELVLEE